MPRQNYEALMAKARRTNALRDASERKAGFLTPDGGPLMERLETAMSAFEAGITTMDWNAVAEGQAMLEVIANDLRKMRG